MRIGNGTACSMALAALLVTPVLLAQHSGGGGGGGGGGGCGGSSGGESGGCGDVYGDLYVIERDLDGVPVPAVVTIEGVPTFVYQPLDALGQRIPLGPEGEALFEEALVEVEFGRCNSMRAPAKVSKMHFDAVIAAIHEADRVLRGVDGRLVLLFGRDRQTIDSPVQNLALYKHLMKKGHLQTDPLALDDSHGSHGEVVYRPALRPEDYPKFRGAARALLPNRGRITVDPSGNVDPSFYGAEPLDNRDLTTAACLLAGAAEKTAWISVDMVCYMNTIMEIGAPSVLTDPVEPTRTYFDFRAYTYQRTAEFDDDVEVMVKDGLGGWKVTPVDTLYWLHHVAPLPNYQVESTNIAAFVQAANDSLRIIEFLHNYAPPEDLWNKTVLDGPFRF